MKIVAAPNAFKGSLSAQEVCHAIEAGVKRVYPDAEVLKVPVADGGDGLCDVLLEPLGAQWVQIMVTGPRFETVEASYIYADQSHTAVIELAKASGLALLKKDACDTMQATTLGTGELLLDAIERGAQTIYLGTGGSATTDGALGIATALGVRFLDKSGDEISPIGASLGLIDKIITDDCNKRLAKVKLVVISDVDNSLFGENGAAFVYAEQKGATKEQIEFLDAGLRHYSTKLYETMQTDISDIAGAGSAGGVGGGLAALFDARIVPGIETVLRLINFDSKLQGAELVFTAEGMIDNQTACNKAPAGVAKAAQAKKICCIAIAGGVGENLDALYDIGIDALFSITPRPMKLNEALQSGSDHVQKTTEQIMRLWRSAHPSH